MSTPSTMERTERLTLADMVVVDADVHVNDTPGALAPYCDPPWRLSLEALHGASYPYLQVPGFAPNMRLDPPIQGSHAYRSVDTAAAMRAELSELEIDIGILFPDHMLTFAALPNIEYATALAQAYIRWLMEEWLLKEPGLYGVVLASPQNPEAAAREIGRAHRRHLPADRRGQPPLGPPHLRPDHGRR